MARTYLGHTQTAANADLDAIVAGTVAGYQQDGSGTVERTVAGKLDEVASLFDFIPVAEQAGITAGTSTYDCSAALTAAFASVGTYGTVVVPKGSYHLNNVAQSLNGQRLVGSGGYVAFYKNANGPVLAVSGDDFMMEQIHVWGVSATYTGNGIETYGARPKFLYCGARDTAARALYMENPGEFEVRGQRNIYATADTSASGWDIEVAGSSPGLYGLIDGIVTTQSGDDGGFKFTDYGSQKITNCQFGKLSVLADTSPSGSNGGTMVGNRILGPIIINLSNSVMVGNSLGSSATLTYGTGTSGHTYIPGTNSNGTITNNGTASSLILHQQGVGAAIELLFGGTAGSAASVATLEVTPSDGLFEFPRNIRVKNNRSIQLEQLSTALGAFLAMTAGDTLQLQNLVSNEFIRLGTTGASSKVDFDINGAIRGAFSVNGHELASFTTAQRDALTGVVAGTFIFNDDTNKLNFYTGAAWEAVTSA